RAARLRLGVAEVPLSGRLRRGAAERAADGLLRTGADRARRARARRYGAAAGCQFLGLGFDPGAGPERGRACARLASRHARRHSHDARDPPWLTRDQGTEGGGWAEDCGEAWRHSPPRHARERVGGGKIRLPARPLAAHGLVAARAGAAGRRRRLLLARAHTPRRAVGG